MTISGPSYCEVSDVINAMTSYNAAGTPAEIDQSIVQQAITQASAKVSSWTSQVWGYDGSGNTIPVPDLVTSITINIAAYYATLSYRKNKPLEANDPVVMRYQDAMADLNAIQTGQISPSPYDPSNGSSGSGDSPGYGRGAVRNTIPKIFVGRDSNTHISRGGNVTPNEWPDANFSAPWMRP